MTKESLQYNINVYSKEQNIPIESINPIPKAHLLIGKKYKGIYKNSSTAIWNGSTFEYINYYMDVPSVTYLSHYEDCDLGAFIPFEKQ